MNLSEAAARGMGPLGTLTDLRSGASCDIAGASLLPDWIYEVEQRDWFLFEAGRRDRASDR